MKRNDVFYSALFILLLGTFFSCTEKHGAETKSAVTTSEPTKRLLELAGTWKTVSNSFGNPGTGLEGTLKVSPVSNSSALFTTYTQGSGSEYYEANALWGYSALTNQVRVFEVNSLGFADTHVGNFDSNGALILRFSDVVNKVSEERTFWWNADTLKMKAVFTSQDKTNENSFTLVRQR